MIFDSYERPLVVINTDRKIVSITGIEHTAKTTAKMNAASISQGVLTLMRQSSSHLTLTKEGRVTEMNKITRGLGFTVPQPFAFTINNTPNLTFQPNGSYDYTPNVSGGVKPYHFSLEGTLGGNLVFDTTTGRLSRPPQ